MSKFTQWRKNENLTELEQIGMLDDSGNHNDWVQDAVWIHMWSNRMEAFSRKRNRPVWIMEKYDNEWRLWRITCQNEGWDKAKNDDWLRE